MYARGGTTQWKLPRYCSTRLVGQGFLKIKAIPRPIPHTLSRIFNSFAKESFASREGLTRPDNSPRLANFSLFPRSRAFLFEFSADGAAKQHHSRELEAPVTMTVTRATCFQSNSNFTNFLQVLY